jgi:hypothetical protein
VIDSSKDGVYLHGSPGEHSSRRLEQALELCASSCLDKCAGASAGEHPDAVWMRLYAASERLRLALQDGDAAKAILEIGSNLMGCEEMGIVGMDQTSGLTFLARSGIGTEHEQALAVHARELLAVIETDEILLAQEEESGSALCSELGITAFVPIWHDLKPRGAIVFFSLLAQRNGLDPADRELLELLSIFSGPSLFSERPGKASLL